MLITMRVKMISRGADTALASRIMGNRVLKAAWLTFGANHIRIRLHLSDKAVTVLKAPKNNSSCPCVGQQICF